MVRRRMRFGRRRWPQRRLALLVMAAAAVVGLPSCQTSPADLPPRVDRPVPPPPVAGIRAEPDVRVRVVTGASRIVLGARSPLAVGPTDDLRHAARSLAFEPPVTVVRGQDGFVLQDRAGRSVAWALPALRVENASGGDETITVNGNAYPGAVVLHPAEAGATIDAVNHVPMERYLPGVIEHELYASWAPETFVAQAIAARSYAIAHQAIQRDRTFDLESSTASQVYGGAAKNPKAIDAVARTRGQVLTYQGRVVPAFFSAASGGTSQDARAAFPHSKLEVDMPPLRGRYHGWGAAGKHFRWGPIVRDTGDLSRRIAAWGRANRHAVANLGQLQRVDVVQQSMSGRPATFRLVDNRRQTFHLPAESFRFASNHAGGGLPKLPDGTALKSSHVRVEVRGPSTIFSDGRGFGHGVGLDQWAAEEMAKQGYAGHAIVTFFYPGAAVEKLY